MKELLRQQYKQKRNSIPKKEILEKSNRIMQKLFSLKEFKNAETIAFYVSVESEVITHAMIEKAIALGKRIAAPICRIEKNKMEFGEISSLKDLQKGAFDIPEPKTGKIVTLQEIDLVVVPGIVFDKKGNRIGHGKGYYDRLLKELPKKTSAVGICFEDNLIDSLPAEKNDSKVKIVLTENKVLRQ